MNRALGVLAVLALLATGCASRGTVNRLPTDVAKLRSDLTAARAAQAATARDLSQAGRDLEALDARVLELTAGVREVRDELARLAARLDTAEEEIKKARALAEPRPPAVAPAPPAAPAAPPAPPAPPAPAQKRAEPRPAQQVYAAALATFHAREYGQAVLDLTDFIGTHRGHPLAANAQYWIGEAYYVQRDYRQALLEFQKVIEMRAAKVPDALVKVGLCQWSLRDPRRARATWQRVVREYAGTEAARTARTLLRKHAAR